MRTPQPSMTALLGQSIDRLAPLVEQAARVLERKGTSASRALKNKLAREIRHAQVLQRTLANHGDYASITALCQEGVDFESRPKRPYGRGSGISLVVDNTGRGAA